MMRCPFCHAGETRVVDSRLSGEADQVRRRRECTECNERFTTFETPALEIPRIVKSDGKRESFDEDKLRAGIQRALEKRPVGSEDFERAINRIRQKLQQSGEAELQSRQLGEWVMEELFSLDTVAYIRFASVYLSFEDVSAFRELANRIEDQHAPRRSSEGLGALSGENPADQ